MFKGLHDPLSFKKPDSKTKFRWFLENSLPFESSLSPFCVVSREATKQLFFFGGGSLLVPPGLRVSVLQFTLNLPAEWTGYTQILTNLIVSYLLKRHSLELIFLQLLEAFLEIDFMCRRERRWIVSRSWDAYVDKR